MKKWECDVCGYIYDPAKGDPDNLSQVDFDMRCPWHCVRGPAGRLGVPRVRR